MINLHQQIFMHNAHLILTTVQKVLIYVGVAYQIILLETVVLGFNLNPQPICSTLPPIAPCCLYNSQPVSNVAMSDRRIQDEIRRTKCLHCLRITLRHYYSCLTNTSAAFLISLFAIYRKRCKTNPVVRSFSHGG